MGTACINAMFHVNARENFIADLIAARWTALVSFFRVTVGILLWYIVIYGYLLCTNFRLASIAVRSNI